ncbi:MAG TPA: dihydrodipicolinate synthase family protein [Candidatus Sumerlaeota bacterium]|nr:dihydrodipicolinate synthase family protein [Candidatus Sumerlaeota bacterium]
MKTRTGVREGVWPVLLTPFGDDLSIDWAALDEMIDYYIAEGVAGVFANCTSSEIFDLQPEEMLQIARRITERAAGRIGVVATGNIGDTLEQQRESMRRLAATADLDAVVISTSMLPAARPIHDEIRLLMDGGEMPLGIYEAPIPVHRTLQPGEVAELAATGRFVFLKETSRQVPVFSQKVELARDTPMQVFQANLACLLEGGEQTGAGFAGTLVNVAPRLSRDYLLEPQRTTPWHHQARELMLSIGNIMNQTKYPASAKYMLQRLGLRIQTACRWHVANGFSAGDIAVIDRFFDVARPAIVSVDGLWRGFRWHENDELIMKLREWSQLTTTPAVD